MDKLHRVEFTWYVGHGMEKRTKMVHFDFATAEEAAELLASFRPNENATIETYMLAQREPESITDPELPQTVSGDSRIASSGQL